VSSGSWGAYERQNSAQSGRPARESGNRAQRNFAAAWPRRKPSVDRWGRGLRRFKTTPQRRRSLSLIERGVDRAGRSAAHFLPSPQRAAQSTTVWVHPLSGGFRLDVLSTPIPEFQTAYREARRAAFGQAVARLQQGASAAATTLLKTMIDPNTPASVRVRAAESVMNHAMKAIEIEDIEARVSALEDAAGKANQRQ